MNEILVPTGLAELVDQIIIVQGKAHAATDPVVRRILAHRLKLMQRVVARVLPAEPSFDKLRAAVVTARQDVMQLEADLRACDARADFGVAFVALTRAYLDATNILDAQKLALDAHADQALPSAETIEMPVSGQS